jgi:hypothetical protein
MRATPFLPIQAVLQYRKDSSASERINSRVPGASTTLASQQQRLFVERSMDVLWGGDPAKLTDRQLETLLKNFEAQRAALELCDRSVPRIRRRTYICGFATRALRQ